MSRLSKAHTLKTSARFPRTHAHIGCDWYRRCYVLVF